MSNVTSLLQLMQARGLGPRKLNRLLRRLINETYSVTDFVDAPINQMKAEYGLTGDMAADIVGGHHAANELAEQLEMRQITAVWLGSDEYPERLFRVLGEAAPPVLFAAGNRALLNAASVGFAGTRDAGEAISTKIRRIAGALAGRRLNIVSGNAPGIDAVAHQAALAENGTTTLVLPTGILHFSPRGPLADLMTQDSCLVISEFFPGTGWAVHNAMQRNSTICALSRVMILAGARAAGGTLAAGKMALKLRIPLFIVETEDEEGSFEGNDLLKNRGARRISSNSDSDLDLAELVEAISRAPRHKPEISLFDESANSSADSDR